MSKKKEPKKIRLETLSDVVNAITPENHVRLMKDFNLWLTLMLATKVVSGNMVDVAMIWTDDGKNEITGWNIEVKKKPD